MQNFEGRGVAQAGLSVLTAFIWKVLGMTTPTFTLSHSFHFSRESLWRAWTDPEQLAKWFGPKGCTLSACSGDFRPGGVLHYCMRGPDGGELWGKWVFREVIPQERLVYVASFSDAQAGITRHPFAADWPLEVLSTMTFTGQDGVSTISMEATPINASAAEHQMFAAGAAGMENGWAGTLEQLDAFLDRT